MRRINRWSGPRAGLVATLTFALGAGSTDAQTTQDSLPEMGTAAQETLSIDEENRLGRPAARRH
jgi:predicted Zn-dependent protease